MENITICFCLEDIETWVANLIGLSIGLNKGWYEVDILIYPKKTYTAIDFMNYNKIYFNYLGKSHCGSTWPERTRPEWTRAERAGLE